MAFVVAGHCLNRCASIFFDSRSKAANVYCRRMKINMLRINENSPRHNNWSLIRLGVLALFVGSICTGCINAKTYVDPQFRKATYQDIKRSDQLLPVTIAVEFQVNGKPGSKQQNVIVSRKVLRVLAATKVFVEANSTNTMHAGNLKITVNDFGDMGAAVGKGFATGLTLGLAGSEVVDNYEMTIVYRPANGESISKQYRHAIHTTIGAHSAPAGMEAVPPTDAFDQVVEEMLLNFIQGLQKEGKL
jgi:hypothetical protein